jgi:bacterioferritin-associated ferredoxin
MNPDDPVCLCFHVSRRKVVNFIRVEKPRRASQLSECFGAGTGCGWCRPYLERILNAESKGLADAEVSPEEYASQRAEYVRKGGGTPPPGATA